MAFAPWCRVADGVSFYSLGLREWRNGRRTRLKIARRKAWGFESPLSHQSHHTHRMGARGVDEAEEKRGLPLYLRWRYGLAAVSLALIAITVFGGQFGLPQLALAFIWTPLPFCLIGFAVTFL